MAIYMPNDPLVLVEGLYEETLYTGDQLISSPTFPELKLTVNQILQQGL